MRALPCFPQAGIFHPTVPITCLYLQSSLPFICIRISHSRITIMASKLFDDVWIDETTELCQIVTYTTVTHQLNDKMINARNFILRKALEFNDTQSTVKFSHFQWVQDQSDTSYFNPTKQQVLDSKYYLLGLRLGPENARYKVAMICHLDTVPASEDSGWKPFDPFVDHSLEYPAGNTSPQDFLVGRGCVDDKGPAIIALIVARALAKKYDNTDTFNDVALEILFDGSEETDMATPNYLHDPKARAPDFGIVFDAMWCVRAEKGGDRPHFEAPAVTPPPSGLYVESVITNPDNSSNTIPDWAEAEIRGDQAALEQFATSVKSMYESFTFDTDDYRRAEMLDPEPPQDGVLKIRTLVMGAQHGSSPDENRDFGANPLVSLANFLAGLNKDGIVGATAASTMCRLVEWMWGTQVYGEKHRDELYGFDDIFLDGNGTTYAVTKMAVEESGAISLEVDIRYAIAHHETQWDGENEGFLDGDQSVLHGRFDELCSQFNAEMSNMPNVAQTVPAEKMTLFVPDVRIPDKNENYQKIEQAFYDIMHRQPPRLAIGGGTDAKGVLSLLAVGPLFGMTMGPPVNYHGISEGAPIADMKKSTEILERVMELEVTEPLSPGVLGRRKHAVKKATERLKAMKARGYVVRCQC